MLRTKSLVKLLVLWGMTSAFANAEVVEIGWDDLLPDEIASFNPYQEPDIGIGNGMPSSTGVSDLLGQDDLSVGLSSYLATSAVVRTDLDDKEVRIPGFIVPLETDDVGNISTFFLVPYFGACIHTPPPPANQIVYGTVEEAFPLNSIWEPFWIEGVIRAEETQNMLGMSGYTMRVDKIEVYDD